MAVSVYFNRVKYTAVSAGTVDFVTSAAVTGFLTPATASITNGSIVSYVAFSSTQTEWETGQGTYTSGTTTLARTTVRESSNAGAKVNFTAAPMVALDFQAQDITNLPPVAINGAAIGTNALAVNGTSLFGTTLTISAGGAIANTSFTADLSFRNGDFVLDATRFLIWSAGGFKSGSTGSITWAPAGVIGGVTDTTLSRNAAGVVQFGTTAANASGSWLATNGTLSGTLDTTGPIRGSHGYTVATLPAAGTAGRMAYVTDALAPSFLTTVVGGGAVVTPVFDNGTNWVGA